MINNLRIACPEVEEWPERFLLIFLLSQEHNESQTLSFLRSHLVLTAISFFISLLPRFYPAAHLVLSSIVPLPP